MDNSKYAISIVAVTFLEPIASVAVHARLPGTSVMAITFPAPGGHASPSTDRTPSRWIMKLAPSALQSFQSSRTESGS